MPATVEDARNVVRQLRRGLLGDPNVVGFSVGYKKRGGRNLVAEGPVLIVHVKQKLAPMQVPQAYRVPRVYQGILTDVKERPVLSVIRPLETAPESLTARKRPCPPGYSVGHPDITAGTLGAWVRDVFTGQWMILTNNHVAANSNKGKPGDWCLQPGPHDGGGPVDRIGKLARYTHVNFDAPMGKKKQKLARAYWQTVRGVANAGAWAFTAGQCRYRLGVPRESGVIDQPNPNLTDAALVGEVNPSAIDLNTPHIGVLQGFSDFQLGDEVEKTGRTTEYRTGMVVEVFAQSIVRFPDGNARFTDQFIIEGDGGADFSAGGDSGSLIYKKGTSLGGGLLFAGGGGVTVANRISNVVSLLSIVAN